MKSEWDDPEFKSLSADGKYIFQERMGMMFGSLPYDQCDPIGIEMAKQEARKFENECLLAS